MQDVPCQPKPAWLIQKLDELAFKTKTIHLCRHIVEGLHKQSQIEEKKISIQIIEDQKIVRLD